MPHVENKKNINLSSHKRKQKHGLRIQKSFGS